MSSSSELVPFRAEVATVLIVGLALERFLSFFSFRKKRREAGQKLTKSWLTVIPILTYITMYFGIVTEFVLIGGEAFLSSTASVIGLLMLIGGIILRKSAMNQFGDKWNVHVDVACIDSLVRTGPYFVIRHPYYLSVIFELLGLAFTLGARLMIVAILLVQCPLLMARIIYEEKELLKKFGLGYLLYRYKTGGLVPKLCSFQQALEDRHA